MIDDKPWLVDEHPQLKTTDECPSKRRGIFIFEGYEGNITGGHKSVTAGMSVEASRNFYIWGMKGNITWGHKSVTAGRSYRIWQRDPLAVLMDSISKIEQKIIYIHNNPLHQKWNLALRNEEYKWSSASFYENGSNDFGFLTRYEEKFG